MLLASSASDIGRETPRAKVKIFDEPHLGHSILSLPQPQIAEFPQFINRDFERLFVYRLDAHERIWLSLQGLNDPQAPGSI
jgi:hypothetical protein